MPDVDVVLDLVGDETAAQSLPALRDGGIVIGVSSGLMARCGRPATALASPTCSSNPTTRDRGARRRGALRPHVARAFPLEDAAQSHRIGQSGRTQGKLALRTTSAAGARRSSTTRPAGPVGVISPSDERPRRGPPPAGVGKAQPAE